MAAPCVTAGRVHPHGEIADQADPHAGLPRRVLRGGNGAIGNPLQELVKQDFVRMRIGKERDRGAARVAQVRRPVAPFPLRHAPGLQRFEARVVTQQLSPVRTESREVRAQRTIPVVAVQE